MINEDNLLPMLCQKSFAILILVPSRRRGELKLAEGRINKTNSCFRLVPAAEDLLNPLQINRVTQNQIKSRFNDARSHDSCNKFEGSNPGPTEVC